jgi:hypothetical protein
LRNTLAVSVATIAEIDDAMAPVVTRRNPFGHVARLGNRLRLGMERCPTGKMTVANLAVASGVSEGTISDIRRGARTNVTPETASLIEAALGFEAGTIFWSRDLSTHGSTTGQRPEPRSQTTHPRDVVGMICTTCHCETPRYGACCPESPTVTAALVG